MTGKNLVCIIDAGVRRAWNKSAEVNTEAAEVPVPVQKILRLWQRKTRRSSTRVWERGRTRGTCRLQRRSERDRKWQKGEAECRLKSQRSEKALSLSPCWLLLPVKMRPAFPRSSCHKISLWADVFDSEFGHVSRGALLEYAPVIGIFGSWVIEVPFVVVVIQSVSLVFPAFEMGKQKYGCHSLTPSLVLLLRSSQSYETEHILSRRRCW